ncbi:unnamed protein product [Adineta ricciae]|uniref:Helicase XPB/Ssl2 N-terminal domain-containing protein n=1 Tax=Adineta ricciae TaxID=249248 RepID=A0A815CA99_ADIRI|nr:unnamed protein product [Adineta ricciae]
MNKHSVSEGAWDFDSRSKFTRAEFCFSEWNEQCSKKLKRTSQSSDDERARGDAYTSFEGRPSATELEDTHEELPLSYTSDGHIILESFTSDHQRAQDLLFAIAEPIHDLERSNIYEITANSLHTAMYFGLNTEGILADLHELSKTSVPICIIDRIKSCTAEYGKVRLVLKQNRYFIECISSHVLTTLLQDPQIQECRLAPIDETVDTSLEGSENRLENVQSTSFEVNQSKVVMLRKRCQQLKYPLVEDYAFAEDTLIPNLNIQLSSKATLRPYQEESLRKVFNNGRARSGVIVLPCGECFRSCSITINQEDCILGAGKSLVGVAAACTINKRCLVLCNSNVSVEQWREQFKTWSTANDGIIRLLTSKNKNNFNSIARSHE